MFRTNLDQLDIKTAEEFIRKYQQGHSRYSRLQGYYMGEHDILQHRRVDPTASNNPVVNNYAKYITDVNTGYFMGKPVRYTFDEAEGEDEKALDTINDILDKNTEKRENFKLAKTCSIKGDAYEIIYINEEGNIRFKQVQPDSCFFIFDTSIENHLLYAVRFYEDEVMGSNPGGQFVRTVEIYDKNKVETYKGRVGAMELVEVKPHIFGEVPFIHYINNEEMIGDFEPVITIIDAYNKAESDTLNDMDDFSDAYLVLTNMNGTEKEDIEGFKKNRVILMDSDGKVERLIKNVNDTWVENIKSRLNADIHKFSFTPDLSDENFAGTASGVSLRYKLLGMEQFRATKEGYFDQALRRRLLLICNALKVYGQGVDEEIIKKINITFNNTLPQNTLEISQIINNLSPYVSKETLLSQVPFIESPRDEVEKKKQEEEEGGLDIYKNLKKELDQKQVDNGER